jgi:hypothetical protein
MPDDRVPRRLFLSDDIRFGDTLLTAIAGETGSTWVLRDPATALHPALCAAGPPIDLIVLSLPAGAHDALAGLRLARSEAFLMEVPALVISYADGGLDLWQLRALGVLGLIDRRVSPEHVRFRINQVIYTGFEGRRHERAPCSIPVELEAGGVVTVERTVTLSEGGMGVSSGRRIEPNTDVVARFRLGPDAEEQLVVPARVVHVREAQRPETRHELGLFFGRVSDHARTAIREEVRSVLDAIGRQRLLPLPGAADSLPTPGECAPDSAGIVN